MAARVLMSGRWAGLDDAVALLNRTYTRDGDGQFASTGSGSHGHADDDEEDLGPVVEPELLATTSGGGRQVATFSDPHGVYGEDGGRVVSISDHGEKPNWRDSDGMDNGAPIVPAAHAGDLADGLEAMASTAKAAAAPQGEKAFEDGPAVLGTTVVGEYRATAFHDGNGDVGSEGERFIQISRSGDGDWRDSLRSSMDRLLDVDAIDATGLASALRAAAS